MTTYDVRALGSALLRFANYKLLGQGGEGAGGIDSPGAIPAWRSPA